MDIKNIHRMSWNQDSYRELQNLLQEQREEKYRQFQKRLIPNRTDILGVRIPTLRKIAAQIVRGDAVGYFELAETASFEEILLRGFIIGRLKVNKEQTIVDIIQRIEQFIPYISDWETCDTFCSSLKITKDYPSEIFELLIRLHNCKDEFTIRFVYVMLLNYYIVLEYLPIIFQWCEEEIEDSYYAKMAMAWLLSICYIKYREETREYLLHCNLTKWVYDKTIQKIIESNQISEEEKKIVRSWKKK